jgi:hypothetical protein
MVFRQKVIWGLAAGLIAVAAAETVDEYQVKGAFVFNFARFIQWPAQAFTTPTEPLVICVLGQDHIAAALRALVGGKSIEGRPVVVRQVASCQPAGRCHILFVGASEIKRFRSSPVVSAGVLTIGESPGFAVEGGIINFKLEGGRVRFEINAGAADRQQFRISAKLLSLAEIVTSEAE